MTSNAKGNLRYRATTTTAAIALVAGGYLVMSGTTAEPAAAESSSRARKVDKLIQDAFRPDPQYDAKYSTEGQFEIYGAKSAVEPPRPPLELGRQQYTSGLYDESSTLLGKLNPLLPGLAIYGDWRTAVAYNSNNGKDIAQIATRVKALMSVVGTKRP